MPHKRTKTGLDVIQKFLGSPSIRKTVYRNTLYYSLNDIVLQATDSVNPKDYIKKLRHRDRVLAIEWPELIRILPGETEGGQQNMKFVDLMSFLRIIQCVPGIKSHEIKNALAATTALAYMDMQEDALELMATS